MEKRLVPSHSVVFVSFISFSLSHRPLHFLSSGWLRVAFFLYLLLLLEFLYVFLPSSSFPYFLAFLFLASLASIHLLHSPVFPNVGRILPDPS